MRITVRYEHFGVEVFKSTGNRDYQPFIPRVDDTLTIDGTKYYVQDVQHFMVSGGNETSPCQDTIVQLYKAL